jgi:hypothetical protein
MGTGVRDTLLRVAAASLSLIAALLGAQDAFGFMPLNELAAVPAAASPSVIVEGNVARVPARCVQLFDGNVTNHTSLPTEFAATLLEDVGAAAQALQWALCCIAFCSVVLSACTRARILTLRQRNVVKHMMHVAALLATAAACATRHFIDQMWSEADDSGGSLYTAGYRLGWPAYMVSPGPLIVAAWTVAALSAISARYPPNGTILFLSALLATGVAAARASPAWFVQPWNAPPTRAWMAAEALGLEVACSPILATSGQSVGDYSSMAALSAAVPAIICVAAEAAHFVHRRRAAVALAAGTAACLVVWSSWTVSVLVAVAAALHMVTLH